MNHHNNVRMYLAIGSLVVMAFMIAGLYIADVPKENVRMLDTAMGFAAGFVSTSFGYYFTASHNSTSKKEDSKSDESTNP